MASDPGLLFSDPGSNGRLKFWRKTLSRSKIFANIEPWNVCVHCSRSPQGSFSTFETIGNDSFNDPTSVRNGRLKMTGITELEHTKIFRDINQNTRTDGKPKRKLETRITPLDTRQKSLLPVNGSGMPCHHGCDRHMNQVQCSSPDWLITDACHTAMAHPD